MRRGGREFCNSLKMDITDSLKMDDSFATTRNGHQLTDNYDPETNTLDIRSNGLYPSGVLSNLCSNGFRFDGMVCGSMEGFLQSLKQKDKDKQRQICSMKGGNARKHSVTSWQTDQIVWWKGVAIDRQGEDYQKLLRRAYQAMFDQSERFRAALMQTRGITLTHSSGEKSPYKTILTEQEFCQILTELRDNYDKRDKHIERERRLLVEEDGLTYEIIVHKDDVSDFDGERISLSYDLFPDMNSVFAYLSVPLDKVTELGVSDGLVLAVPRKLLDGYLLVVETDAEFHHHPSLDSLKSYIEKNSCGLQVIAIKETDDNKLEIVMEPIPDAPQEVVFADGVPRLSPAGTYVLATDFCGEFFIGLMLEDKDGNRTPLWGEDYCWK